MKKYSVTNRPKIQFDESTKICSLVFEDASGEVFHVEFNNYRMVQLVAEFIMLVKKYTWSDNDLLSDELTMLLHEAGINEGKIESEPFDSLKGIEKQSELNIYIPSIINLTTQEFIVNACGEFMEAMGFEVNAEQEPIYNSFWKRIQFVLKRNISEQDLDRVFRKGKQALEQKLVDSPIADQTEKYAAAAQKLIQALETVDNAAIRAGALLIFKETVAGTPFLYIHQLTSDQIYALETQPALIKNVATLNEWIKGTTTKEQLAQYYRKCNLEESSSQSGEQK